MYKGELLNMERGANQELGKLNEKEARLIRLIRELGYGELHLYISEGVPVRVEEVKKSIKL